MGVLLGEKQVELISVVMCVYNEKEEWLRMSMESILSQTYSNFEYIIVLDNPENEVLKNVLYEYEKQDERIKVIVNHKNEGLVFSLNKGIASAKGKYIARMDADDYSMPERLEKQYECVSEKNVDFVMANIDFYYDEEYQRGGNFPELNSQQIEIMMKYGNVSIHPTWFFDKKIFEKLNGYRYIKCCEDLDFVLRAIQEGFKCYKMSEHLLCYRFRNAGISKSNALEQYVKATILRKRFACKRLLKELQPIDLDRICQKYTEEDKLQYEEADRMMDEFVRVMNNRMLKECILNILNGFKNNKFYRKLFRRNVIYRIVLMKYVGKYF